MENQSQNQAQRRHRGNRSGGRSRNRQGNQSRQGDKAQGRSRSQSRNRRGSRSKQPKQTLLQRILSVLTFGLLGKPKAKARPARKPEAAQGRQPAAKPPKAADEPRKPKRNRAEVTSARLYVGNLDYSTGEVELEELFKGVGNVLSAEVVTNPRTQQSKGFAFVEMGSIEEAKRAVGILDDQEFMGRRLIVSGARSEGAASEEGEAALVGSPAEERA